MPFHDPLPKAALRDIWERQDASDINALLWEIKRLRSIVLRIDQLQRCLGNVGGGPGILLQGLRH